MDTTHIDLLKWIRTLSRVSMLIEPTFVFFLSKAFSPAATWRRRWKLNTRQNAQIHVGHLQEICETDLLSPLSTRTALSRCQDGDIHLEKRCSFVKHDIWRIFFSFPSIPVISYFLFLTLPVRGSVADCLSASLCSLAASFTSSSSTKLLNLILETKKICLRDCI